MINFSMKKKRLAVKLKHPLKRWQRILAAYLLITIVSQVIYPTAAFALTGGPSQPEVESFTPVGTSDMVDVFSGDFSYNIPLLDVDGYPINIAYHSGVTMDQEATWVGLGWNINPGVINRAVRGLPDDFNGDVISTETNIKPNFKAGLRYTRYKKLFGKKFTDGSNYGANISYSNYTGLNFGWSASLSAATNQENGPNAQFGLGLNSSIEDGLTVSPNASLSGSLGEEGKTRNTGGLTLKVGSSFNSRAGLQTMSMGVSAKFHHAKKATPQNLVEKNPPIVYSKYKGGRTGNIGSTWSLQQPTFSPEIQNEMFTQSYSFSYIKGKVVAPGQFKAKHGFEGYFSIQALKKNNESRNAYGMMYQENAGDNSLMDFNREKEENMTAATPNLHPSQQTNDVYGVAGQGIGGSYRIFRNDVGTIHDPYKKSNGFGIDLGFEYSKATFPGELPGSPVFKHLGISGGMNFNKEKSGPWDGSHNYRKKAVGEYLPFRAYTNEKENFYFKEANERSIEIDEDLFENFGGMDGTRIEITGIGKDKNKKARTTNLLRTKNGVTKDLNSFANYTSNLTKRNQNLSYVFNRDYPSYAIENISGVSNHSDHHIAEITALNPNGERYVYGLPLYNNKQEDYSFAVGAERKNQTGRSANFSKGEVDYADKDMSLQNDMGIDHYYQKTSTPEYAHSYLLTSILSPDYIDNDNKRGPSDGDFGNYVKFEYTKNPIIYKWRTPFGDHNAAHNPGLLTDTRDNKANILYGEKELRYLEKIITKNYVAVFETSDRKDALGVADKNGAISSDAAMKRLDKIKLYSKPDYLAHINDLQNATPLKVVHFEYDYSLCKNIPNYFNGEPNKGKLTLKRIYFTYQNSNKGRLSPYEFAYANNPDYDQKAYDRWGMYKPLPDNAGGSLDHVLYNDEFPYVDQTVNENEYASAWCLTKIDLPTSGSIKVEYESDDYAFVQDKQINRMLKLDRVSIGNTETYEGAFAKVSDVSIYEFKKIPDVNADVTKYVNVGDVVYFKSFMRMAHNTGNSNIQTENGAHGEYVTGYATVTGVSDLGSSFSITLQSLSTKDNGNGINVSPLSYSAIKFARNYLGSRAFVDYESNNTGVENTIWQLFNFVPTIIDAFTGINKAVFNNGYSEFLSKEKTWFRFKDPSGKKKGGGVRVKKISMSDNWTEMSGATETAVSNDYTVEYDYTTTGNNGDMSSGVATYEPLLGGDENPFRQPINFSIEKRGAPDEREFQEEPIGEAFFPQASVGYSKVTVRTNKNSDYQKHGTGKSVNEFYTAKDFPTIVSNTDPDKRMDFQRGLRKLLKIKSKHHLAVSQGFSIINNDMHGKPKSVAAYAEGGTEPITMMEYVYKKTTASNGTFRLKNDVDFITPDGKVKKGKMGIFWDRVADTKYSFTSNKTAGLDFNLERGKPNPPFPIPFIWPKFSISETEFKSVTLSKSIMQFGILDKVIARDLGSVVETEDIAYDSETGQVLLTKTKTDFNDAVYSLNIPAHWYYDEGMGAAYKNVGYKTTASFNTSGEAAVAKVGYFVPGDEVGLSNGTRAWVVAVTKTTSKIKLVYKDGAPVTGSLGLEILRSGRRNLMMTSIGSITTLENPLNQIESNNYSKVLNATAVEFTDKAQTYCDCFTSLGSGISYSTNPYIKGLKGVWKGKKSYTYLTDRTTTNHNNNSNIRKDGVYTQFNTFYKNENGKWQVDDRNWTFVSQITAYSPYSVELENKDALNRYSAAQFGYNQTLATAVAANTRYSELGFDNFEDYDFSKCADSHFKMSSSTTPINTNESHTGYRSLKVSSTEDISLTKTLKLNPDCDFTDCTLDLGITGAGTSIRTCTPSGANGDVQWLTTQVISGDVSFAFGSDGTILTITGSSPYWEVLLTILDEGGCRVSKIIKSN